MSYVNTINAEEFKRRNSIVRKQNLSDDLTVGAKVAHNPRVEADKLLDSLTVEPEIDSLGYYDELLKGDM